MEVGSAFSDIRRFVRVELLEGTAKGRRGEPVGAIRVGSRFNRGCSTAEST